MGGNALGEGMRIRITPTEPPIVVDRVESIERQGEPCWLVVGLRERVPLHGGGCSQQVRYVVPKSYRGMRAA